MCQQIPRVATSGLSKTFVLGLVIAILANYLGLSYSANPKGGNDYGVFVVAFATSLCSGDSPPTITYHQAEPSLCRNLLECLKKMCGSHWIAVSNVNCEPSTVDVHDSAYVYIDSDTKQICSFFRPVGDVLKLRMPNTQCQPNSFSCGVLAIATATKLTLGKDPLLCYWDTTQIRCHLIQRLEQGKWRASLKRADVFHSVITIRRRCPPKSTVYAGCLSNFKSNGYV